MESTRKIGLQCKQENSYMFKVGRDNIRVISIFSGTKTASEAIHDAAVKKILYDGKDA